MNDFKFYFKKSFDHNAICVYLTDGNKENYSFDNGKLITKDIVEGDSSSKYAPFAVIAETEGQRIIDMLWDCGLRPTAGQGSAGQLEAVRHHLEDMRKITFKKLGM